MREFVVVRAGGYRGINLQAAQRGAAQQRKAVAREVEVIERHETFQIAAAFDEPLRGGRIVLPGNCRQAETERIPGQGRLFERGAQTIQEIPRQYRCRA